MKRRPASTATRERLAALFGGTSEAEDAKGALVRQAVRLMAEEALEAEAAGPRDGITARVQPSPGVGTAMATGRGS